MAGNLYEFCPNMKSMIFIIATCMSFIEISLFIDDNDSLYDFHGQLVCASITLTDCISSQVHQLDYIKGQDCYIQAFTLFTLRTRKSFVVYDPVC